jgi:hypothetical protein
MMNRTLSGVADALESDGIEYLAGETVEARLLTRTSTETLAASAAPVSSL